jgi:hypothetical protein
VLLRLTIRREFGQVLLPPHLLDVSSFPLHGPALRTSGTYTRSLRGASYTLPLYQSYLERADNLRIIHPIAMTPSHAYEKKSRSWKKKGVCHVFKESRAGEKTRQCVLRRTRNSSPARRSPLFDYLLGSHHTHLAYTNRRCPCLSLTALATTPSDDGDRAV